MVEKGNSLGVQFITCQRNLSRSYNSWHAASQFPLLFGGRFIYPALTILPDEPRELEKKPN